MKKREQKGEKHTQRQSGFSIYPEQAQEPSSVVNFFERTFDALLPSIIVTFHYCSGRKYTQTDKRGRLFISMISTS